MAFSMGSAKAMAERMAEKARAAANAAAKGTREAARGVGGIEILEPVRFSVGSDVAAATRLLQNRLGDVHARHIGDRDRLPSAA